MFKKLVLSLVVLMLLSLPVLAEDQNKVVAVVRGQEITLAQLDEQINMSGFIMDLYQMNPQFTQILFTTPEGEQLLNAYRKQQLTQFTDQLILVLEAKSRGITLSPEKIDEIFAEQIENIKVNNNLTDEQLIAALQEQGIESLDAYKQMFVEKSGDALLIGLLQKEVTKDVTVSEEEIKAYYDNNADLYSTEPAVRARHILVESKEVAEELLAKVKGGADMAEIAKASSICPSASKGGDLGFIQKGQTVEEFDAAIFSMQAGQTSELVKTDYGYHIIRVEEVRAAGTLALDIVKGDIKADLTEQKTMDIWNKFADELKKNTVVEIKM